MPDIKLSGSSKFDYFLTHHFPPLRDPSDGPCECEDDSEHVSGYLERLQHDARVEVNIRVELTLLKVIIIKCCLFEGHRQLKELLVLDLQLVEHFVTHLLHLFSSRVEVLIDSMAETHNTEGTVLILGFFYILWNSIFRFDFIKHLEACLVGPSMSGSPEGGNTR